MSATSREVVVGARKGTTWGTPVVVGPNNGILVRPSAIDKDQGFTTDDSLGLGDAVSGDYGEIKVEGSLVGYMRYDGLALLIGMAMGGHSLVHTVPTAGGGTAASGTATTLVKTAAGWGVDAHKDKYVTVTAGTNAGVTRKITANTATELTFGAMPAACDATTVFTISGAATTHTYTLAPNTDGQFITVLSKISTLLVEEITSAKVAGFTIKGGTGKPVEFVFPLICHGKNINTTTGTNTLTTAATITFPETANRMLYRDLVFRMNAASAGALASTGATGYTGANNTGDRLFPNTFEFNFKPDIKGLYGSGSGADNIDEPRVEGLPNVGMKFELPRAEADGLAVVQARETSPPTPQKFDFKLTGALLSGSTYRSFFCEAPNARFLKATIPIKDGALSVPVELSCMAAAAAPTGMTALTARFRVTMVDSFGGDVLQEAI
jgi:hypothetical protein